MSWSVNTEAGMIRLSGHLDHSEVVAAREALARALRACEGTAVLELSGLESAHSAVISLLLRTLAEAERRGIELKIESMPRRLYEMARVGGLDGIFNIQSLAT